MNSRNVFLKYHYLIITILISLVSFQAKAQSLDKQQQSIAIISALASKGHLNDLEAALATGMDNGLTTKQIKAILSVVSSNTSSSDDADSQKVLEKLLKNRNPSNAISNNQEKTSTSEMLFRIAEIEVFPAYVEEYKKILKYEADASVKLENGVIAIMPMYQKESPNQIRILEIYSSQDTYEQHLGTPHFKYYKESTLEMIKSLKLMDMDVLSPDMIPLIFTKL